MAELAKLPECLNSLVLAGHLKLSEAWAAMDEALQMGEMLSLTEAGMVLECLGMESAAMVLYLTEQLDETAVIH